MRHILVALALMLSSANLWADGKFYSERVPPDIPYQRALILFSGGKETMFLQSKFSPGGAAATNSNFGWVVPVPAPPELGSMSASDASWMFHQLDGATLANKIILGPIVIHYLVIAVIGWAFIGGSRGFARVLFRAFIPSGSRRPKLLHELLCTPLVATLLTIMTTVVLMVIENRPFRFDGVFVYNVTFTWCVLAVFGVLVVSVAKLFSRVLPDHRLNPDIVSIFLVGSGFISFFMAFGSRNAALTFDSIEVLQSQDVGIYNAKVIRAKSSSYLVSWLNENGFRFQMSDEPVLNDYIRRSWCFVVARVKPSSQSSRSSYDWYYDRGMLIDPLILRFPSPSAVYPLALTGTIGKETEILIYLVSDRKMQCGNRLKTLFAGNKSMPEWEVWPKLVGDIKLLTWDQNLNYLCKFKGTLTSEQMRQDLEFATAPDNKDYREFRIEW